MSFMEINQFLMSVSDLINHSEVVMISQMSCFDMNPIKMIMMSDSLSPNPGDLRIFPLGAPTMMSMVMNLSEMFKDKSVNSYFFVTHFKIFLYSKNKIISQLNLIYYLNNFKKHENK